MAGVIVGGITIPIAASGISRDRDDLTDRARAFDGTYRASATGTPKRDFHFSTPPILRWLVEGYEMMLKSVVALPCSGDVIGGGKNDALWSRDLTNAAWTKTTMTASPNQIGIDGVANSATGLQASAGNATVSQSITLASSARFMSAYVFRGVGTGVIEMTTDAGGADWVAINPASEWQRFSIPTKTLANPNVGFRIVTSGDAIGVDFVQNESGTSATAPTLTTTVAVNNLTLQCCPEITSWTPVRIASGHAVVIGFSLHEI